MIKVLIADDVQILRRGLEAVLSTDGEIKVIGEAANGKEALEMCIKHSPDVVLMDMRMPEYDGEYGTRQIKTHFPDIKVLVLTTFDDSETVQKAVACGADGYILKEMENEKIINAIKTVNSGINVFGATVFSSIKQTMPVSQPSAASFDISERDRELMTLICDGCDNKEIAARLFLAEGTVRNNISKLLEKLGLKDRTQLAVFAVKNNLV
ncbi:MAG: response regulator transcription factor [Oscillospiraceae bacterium]|nr:response regulator transcription factor [Oscillospiraceae bacterium]MDY2846824.1 response regulator transcription factor [Oscillospiraceae bacterium]